MRKRCDICRGEREFSVGGHCTGCGTQARELPEPVVQRHELVDGVCGKCTSNRMYRNSQYQLVCAGCGEIVNKSLPRPVVLGDGVWLFRYFDGEKQRAVRIRVLRGWIIECPDELPEWRNREFVTVVRGMRCVSYRRM